MHEAVLPTGTAKVAASLARWGALDQFYLAGGTALALHLGHRRSRDLDVFTRAPTAALPPLAGLDGMVQQFAEVQWDRRTGDPVPFWVDQVSVTLLAYPFRHRFPHRAWQGIAVADARDVAVQKARILGRPFLGRRAQARDYVDMHALLTRGVVSLDELLAWGQETYRDAFSPRLFLQQLTYTEDVADVDSALTLLVDPVPFSAIAADLAHEVEVWARGHWPGATPIPGEPRP